MTTTVSAKPPTSHLHHSLSTDDYHQYDGMMNDDSLCAEYMNEISPDHQSPAKDGVYRTHTEQQAVPTRCSSTTGKPTVSPYLQKLPHSSFLQVMPPRSSSASINQRRNRRRRRRSTSTSRTREGQIDRAYLTSNVDHLDLSSFFANSNQSFNRPTSAPTRPMPSSAKKKRVGTSSKKTSSKGQTLIINVYRNGDHNRSCYCKANSLNSILQYATEKLQLSLAARRLFDANGQEVYRVEDLQVNQDYYVSCGENFKDPFKSIQIQTEYSLHSTWTMKGLKTDATKPKSFKTQTVISKRLDKQIKLNTNLTIIENGFGLPDAVYHMIINSTLKENFERFLEDCTIKLKLTAHGRKVFNYRGDEIKSLKDFLELDDCEMKGINDDIVGPLWISKGERFRPTGAYIFLELRYKEFRELHKKLRVQYREVKVVLASREEEKQAGSDRQQTSDDEDSTNESSDMEESKPKRRSVVKDKSLLSMRTKELNELKITLESKIKETKEIIYSYQAKMNEINDAKDEEKGLGAKFSINHITEVDFYHKIVGRHPIPLKVHINGSFSKNDPVIYLSLRGLPSKNAGQISIEYLLEHLQKELEVFAKQRPKRVFDINGQEITLIGQLQRDQHIFVSFGEEFKNAYEPCLGIQLHSVAVYKKDDRMLLVKVSQIDDTVVGEHEKRTPKQIAAGWKPAKDISKDAAVIDYQLNLNDDEKQRVDQSQNSLDERVSDKVTFLVRNRKLMYPELKIQEVITIDSKPKPGKKGERPQKRVFSDVDLQTWCYDKDGYIYNKQISSLVLTVVPSRNISVQLPRNKSVASRAKEEQTLLGYSVQLCDKDQSKVDSQIWMFTTDGYIVSKAYPELPLTDVTTIVLEGEGEDQSFAAKGIRPNPDDPYMDFLGVCAKLSDQSPLIHRQRWGIRQISGFTIGDWKHSKVENPEWHKMALTWPVDSSGQLIPELQWPVEGYLIPHVPSLNAPKSTLAWATFVPIRLKVLKNGERDFVKSVSVVGPDISNLILEPKSSKEMYRRLRIPEPEKEQRAHRQIKRMADARQREIKLFLESCTTLCNLPFAARRLFDVNGTEIFDLTGVPRDSYVYVTCGEQWIDPGLTKAEQQRRALLACLSSDVRMISFYCQMRNPQDYVIAAERGLVENSGLILNRCALTTKQRERVEKGESIPQVIENEKPLEAAATEPEPRTAHDRSHMAQDKKSQESFRWPWEKIANKSLNLDDDDVVMTSNENEDSGEPSNPVVDDGSSFKPMRHLPKSVTISMERFRWESQAGYISCIDDHNLVFGVKEIESKIVEVILKRRNPDDIYQRWHFIPSDQEEKLNLSTSFFIVSKARPTMVLTIQLPSSTGDDATADSITCVGCTLTLQARRYEETGCANQKWSYNQTLGFFFGFQASRVDREITAANRAGICSYTVTYEAISQQGFTASVLNVNDQSEDVPVCVACAQAMRGKCRLVRIESDKKFVCAIGKRIDLKFQGPFQCLNHKVDLTHDEAEHTLMQRTEQLEQLRQEASVRNIAKELAAAKQVRIVHLLAYRNGDGHTRQGQLLIGSSIIGLLDQATHRLSLTSAARRFYTVDGTIILNIDDLIEWAKSHYQDRYRKIANPPQKSLLDQVELNTPIPPKHPETKRRQSDDNQSDKAALSTKIRDLSPNKQRFQGLPKPSDLRRAIKQTSVTSLEVDMDYLLKFPIEIWVSTGEPFVKPADADLRQNQRIVQREQRAAVEHDFEKEKHALRLMKGRRVSGQTAAESPFNNDQDEHYPKKGQWTNPTDAELDKQNDVELLRASVDAMRMSQQPEVTRPVSTSTTDRLSQHSKIKRVMVYVNGEPRETAIQCFGSNLNEIMNNAKVKLSLMQPTQALFDEAGNLIERFDQLNRDQYVCVSTTKNFITSSERQREVDIKANWARTRNQYGDQATDIRVNSTLSSAPKLADPFGPPLLTLDDHRQARNASKPPTVPVQMYRRLPIEQSAPTSAIVTEVTPSPNMMRDSLILNENSQTNVDDDDDDDDGPSSEIARITNEKPIEYEDSRPSTPRFEGPAKSPFSQLFTSEPPPTEPTTSAPSTNKSDSDEDEFIAMLRRK